VLDSIVSALSKNALDPAIWQELHTAAVRHDRVSELAFAYESTAQGRKLRTFLPAVQSELFFRAATFFGDVLGDEFGATTYLERALTALRDMTGTEAPKRRGRPPGKRAEATAPAAAQPERSAKKQSGITEEGRQRLRRAMKKRWAAKRAAEAGKKRVAKNQAA
jgi:hypothetical protein